MIEACGATLEYNDHGRAVYACNEIDMAVAPGEFVGILGPSGSGKSSLLYLLSGLKSPTRGEIRYLGRSLSGLSDAERSGLRLREFGFIFQQPFLLGYLSALENVIVAGGRPSPPAPSPSEGRGELRNQATELLALLGLEDKARRRPHELSGGERQRVCVARALLGKPKAIFADEPTAALDHTNGVQVVNLLRQHRGDSALIMVTHDPSMLEKADRVLQIVEGRLHGA